MHNRIAALAALTLTLAGAARAAPPTTVFYDGKVFTADPDQPYATAVAVRGQTILAVGSDAEVLRAAGKQATAIDLKGRTLIPGLNDAHVHIALPECTYLNTNAFIPGDGPTLQEVKDLIAGAQGQVAPGEWLCAIVGTAVLEDPNATRAALDPISGTNPVWLQGWSGHGTILNTAAMRWLGLSETEADPFGGVYDRYPGTRTLTGGAHEYAEFLVWRKRFAAMSDAQLAAIYQGAAAQAIQLGLTSWQDMAVGVPHARIVRVLEGAGLPLRVRSICFQLALGEGCALGAGSGDVTPSGIKWITDGTPIERRAFLDEDYADDAGWRGALDLPGDAMLPILLQGLLGPPETHQLLFHSVGDGAVDDVLDNLTVFGGPLWRGRRTRIEHADLLFPYNYPRMREVGAMVVQNPRHLTLTALFAERFTPGIFDQLEPLRSLAEQGIPLALGTDSVGGEGTPWLDVMLAAIHPTRPSEALTVEEAITAFTRGAAYAEFADGVKGTLAPGMLADLAVLSQDPFTVPIPALPATASLLTLVGGRIVWDAGVVGH